MTATPDRAIQPRPVAAADLTEALGEFLRHRSGRVLGIHVLVVGAVRLALGRFTRRDVAIAAGVALWWPFQEWLAHRYVLHAPPRTVAGRTIDPAAARYHRAHHADPWNPRYALLPDWVVLPVIPLQALAWLVLAPTRRLAVSGMLAVGTATLVYEWTHFLTHTSYRPKRSWYRRLQRRHRLHHFKDEHLWLGFTVPWVDDLLGTAPDPARVPTSPTVRTLGVTDVA